MVNRLSKTCCVMLALAQAPYAMAADTPPKAGEHIVFIACPMVRDTYLPAWLAGYKGELYYLGSQGDLGTEFYPPQLGHKALVEGVVSGDERVSGGVVLTPVQVSVLPEPDVSCNTILPASSFADPPHHRTPGPSDSYTPPRRAPPPPPPPPYVEKDYEVLFAFDVPDRLFLRDTAAVAQAANYAKTIGAKHIKVIGYRSGALLTGGDRIMEDENVGERRAAMVAKMLVHAGVDPAIVKQEARSNGSDLDGVDDFKLRHAQIIVMP